MKCCVGCVTKETKLVTQLFREALIKLQNFSIIYKYLRKNQHFPSYSG